MVHGSATMAEAPVRHKFTVEEYHRMGEVGIFGEDDRVELLDGDIVVMAPISSRHAGAVNGLNAVFGPLAPKAILAVQNPIQFGKSEPQPDFVLLRPREDRYSVAHPGPDDVLLLVEVAQTSLPTDRGEKAELYAEAGIREYWLLDLPGGRIEIRRDPESGVWGTLRTAKPGEELAPLAFPDFTVRVEDLLP